MRSIRAFLSYCCISLMACLGFAGSALASENQLTYLLHGAVANVGFHGAESAKFRAEQTYMVGLNAERLCIGSHFITESNGYRLAELVNTLSDSEVAKGKTGVSAGNVA